MLLESSRLRRLLTLGFLKIVEAFDFLGGQGAVIDADVVNFPVPKITFIGSIMIGSRTYQKWPIVGSVFGARFT